MAKKILYTFVAIMGVCIGILLHCSFMIVEAGGCYMLPLIEPGQKVLVYLEDDNIKKNDLVAVYAPFYTLEGEKNIIFRRVKAIDDDGMTLTFDADMTKDEELVLSRKELVGKVVLPNR